MQQANIISDAIGNDRIVAQQGPFFRLLLKSLCVGARAHVRLCQRTKAGFQHPCQATYLLLKLQEDLSPLTCTGVLTYRHRQT